jgi:cytosine/adenosine deaminase-related metal-dependent hydrolase
MNHETQDAHRPLVIRGGLVLDAESFLGAADVLIQDSAIIDVGAPGMAAPQDALEINAARRLLHPGLVNAHTHGHGNLARSMGDRWTLELLWQLRRTCHPMTASRRSAYRPRSVPPKCC